MKRIEAIIKEEKLTDVLDALKKANFQGVTITKSQGRGSGERPQVRGGRGTMSYTAEFNRLATIVTVVDNSKESSALLAILSAASRGGKGDGKIFVSTIDEAYDIGTKEKGPKVI
ncbi:MAG TPA: P-II family nitrogen regulator [Nitrosopumilaceae archaeon]|nr:P-II family nitrogen regulator [Nitrosopumilaceae archaeon]